MSAIATLKKLEFEYARAAVLSIEHSSRVAVEWKLKATTQILSNLKFFVDRGESPDELEPILGPINGSRCEQLQIDYTPSLINLHKVYYYRVRAVETVDGTEVQTFKTLPFTWDPGLDLTALYVIEEKLFEHQWVSGLPVAIFKKMTEGERCQVCWDTVLKRVTRSNCKSCHGTGFSSGVNTGYYLPLMGWMKFEPDPKVTQIAEWGERQVRQTDVEFTNYPILSIGDLVVEVKTMRYWRITNVRFTEKNRTIMTQFARLDEINRSDVEYDLEVPREKTEPLLGHLQERVSTPEF